MVHPANIQDRAGAKILFRRVMSWMPRLRVIYADGGYTGKLVDWCGHFGGWLLTVIPRRPVPRFVVVPKRWVVERTFAWLGRYRRLSKDYEATTASSTAWIHVAMVCLMTNRLARSHPKMHRVIPF